MNILYLNLALLCLSFNLSAGEGEHLFRTSLQEAPSHTYATATVDLSDEFPPQFPLTLTNTLTVRTIQTNAQSRPKHGIHYPETFPNVEKLIFWRGSVGNIDFDSLGQLPSLREILFHEVSFHDDQIQLFAPLQHMQNLTLVFYVESIFYQKRLEIMQNFLPNATIKFYSKSTTDDLMMPLL